MRLMLLACRRLVYRYITKDISTASIGFPRRISTGTITCCEIVRDLEQQNHVLNIDAEAYRDQPFFPPRRDRQQRSYSSQCVRILGRCISPSEEGTSAALAANWIQPS
jgi:hypothetical protein